MIERKQPLTHEVSRYNVVCTICTGKYVTRDGEIHDGFFATLTGLPLPDAHTYGSLHLYEKHRNNQDMSVLLFAHVSNGKIISFSQEDEEQHIPEPVELVSIDDVLRIEDYPELYELFVQKKPVTIELTHQSQEEFIVPQNIFKGHIPGITLTRYHPETRHRFFNR